MPISEPRIVRATGQATGSSTARGVGVSLGSGANTNSELQNMYRHVDTQIGAVRSEMKGQIATVMATIREAEAQRSVDFNALRTSVDKVSASLPTTATMWKIIGTVTGGAFAMLALLWAVFGSGASTTGIFADKVLEQREQQAEIRKSLDILLKDKANDNTQTGTGKR